MGSGKSTVGQHLANVLNIPFYDLDLEIEKELNKTIPEIFNDKGEIYFRQTEYRVLVKRLEATNNYVLALGGGTPCYGNVMQFIKKRDDVVSIFLQMPFQELTERLFSEITKRPLISHLKTKEDLSDFIRKHLFERNFYYNQSEYKVKANAGVEKVVSEILVQLF